MDRTVVTYAIYLAISIGLTVWVARTLSRNGQIFLKDVLQGREDLAEAVNHLLVVGFYLVNLGFVALYLKVGKAVENARGSFEALSLKVGTVLLVLGVLHLLNVYVLSRIRRRGLEEDSYADKGEPRGRNYGPPIRPQAMTNPAPGV
ncbi:hypothetical protein [Streptomyces sp. SID3343]|uniref:hypothetical protein n=1 Tax=Streptomyces sp. SID3343 TaxID=2690260 RepID=UPI00136CB7E7|nr:hypothetical protein [Streptomyces sp. SID3343]MYV97056.1 hypothetical protein [Streptomyces sp. SID3343]